jgi:hypothetical protein
VPLSVGAVENVLPCGNYGKRGARAAKGPTSAARELTRLTANCIPIAESRHIRDRPSPPVEQARQWAGFHHGFFVTLQNFCESWFGADSSALDDPAVRRVAAIWQFLEGAVRIFDNRAPDIGPGCGRNSVTVTNSRDYP